MLSPVQMERKPSFYVLGFFWQWAVQGSRHKSGDLGARHMHTVKASICLEVGLQCAWHDIYISICSSFGSSFGIFPRKCFPENNPFNYVQHNAYGAIDEHLRTWVRSRK